VGANDAAERPPGRHPWFDWLRVAVGAVVAVVAIGGLAEKAVHGGQTVQALRTGTPVAKAKTDDAYYRCLDIQARSVVSPGKPVLIGGPNLGAYITLLKAVGSWVTLAAHKSRSDVVLALENKKGPGTCLGNVVEASATGANGRTRTVTGSGDSVPGHGPPPAPPL
jgi:hypothetical protein